MVLISFRHVRAAGLILHGSCCVHLSLFCPCCHGLCEALDCCLSTLPLPEGPPAQLQDQALGSGPQQQAHRGSGTVRTRRLKCRPPSKSRSDSGPCKDPVPHHLLHPSANSHLLHPCCPWGLRSPCSTTISEPLVWLNTEVPLPLHSPAVWSKKGIMRPKSKQANSSATLKLLITTLNTCRLSWIALSYGTKLNRMPFHDLPDGCEVAGEVVAVSIKRDKM